MKFGASVNFNAVEEWRDQYIDYEKLKRISLHIERLEEALRQRQDLSSAALRHSIDLGTAPTARQHASLDLSARDRRESAPVATGRTNLSLDLSRVPRAAPPQDTASTAAFSAAVEAEDSFDEHGVRSPLLGAATPSMSETSFLSGLLRERKLFTDTLEAEIRKVAAFVARMKANLAADAAALSRAVAHCTSGARPANGVREPPEAVAEEAAALYVRAHRLAAFVIMNREGFRKVLKKHDKVTDVALSADYLPQVAAAIPESDAVFIRKLEQEALQHHAAVKHGGSAAAARAELDARLDDVISFSRASVWREHARFERGRAAVNVASGKATSPVWLETRVGRGTVLALAVIAFLATMHLDTMAHRNQQNCLAMLVLLSILWCTEVIPLYVTSMLVPALTVLLRVLPDPHHAHRDMPAPEAAQRVFSVMFSPVIMLLLGGFAIAAALSKHYIAKAAATSILSRVHRPASIVLATMFVATFASMWISNVAAPVLCFSLIQPILRRQTIDGEALSKSLVMGVAMASNVGGMTSPISSPQNIFAISLMSIGGEPPSWLSWFVVALPVACVLNVLIWLLLLVLYRPGAAVSSVRPLPTPKDRITVSQVAVVAISVVTVLLWCCSTAWAGTVGNQGIVALLPLVAFFGSGILDKDDFNSFLWHVVMLAQGGLVLSEAVKECGILKVAAGAIEDATDGLPLWQMVAVFCALVLVCTTFVSHTVGAMVILPVVASVGAAMPQPHPRLLVMATALMCSGAMGLPVSGFPNMTAIALEDATGKTYVGLIDFLKTGLPASAISWVVVVTLGYGLMYALGY